MSNPTNNAQQEMEDVDMMDASPYGSPQGALQAHTFSGMDLSNPHRGYTPEGMKKIVPFAGSDFPGSNTQFLHPPKEKMKLPLSVMARHACQKVPGQKSFHFSANSERQQQSTGPVLPRVTEIQAYRTPTPYKPASTTYGPGLDTFNHDRLSTMISSNRELYKLSNNKLYGSKMYDPKKWNTKELGLTGQAQGSQKWNTTQNSSLTGFKPTARPLVSQNTSRDSSFSSFDTQKSTDDGKENSFDSVTSVSTAPSYLPQKPPVVGKATNGFDTLTTSSTASSLQPSRLAANRKPKTLAELQADPSYQPPRFSQEEKQAMRAARLDPRSAPWAPPTVAEEFARSSSMTYEPYRRPADGGAANVSGPFNGLSHQPRGYFADDSANCLSNPSPDFPNILAGAPNQPRDYSADGNANGFFNPSLPPPSVFAGQPRGYSADGKATDTSNPHGLSNLFAGPPNQPRGYSADGKATDTSNQFIDASQQAYENPADGKATGLSNLFSTPKFHTRKRGNADDFMALFGTPSSNLRKRSVDEEIRSGEPHTATADVASGSASKYRRLSGDEPSIGTAGGEPTTPDHVPTVAQRTSFASPSQPVLEQTAASATLGSPSSTAGPATPVNAHQATNSTTTDSVPGCWPVTPTSTPHHSLPDVATHAGGAFMSGSLPPAQPEHSSAQDSPNNGNNEMLPMRPAEGAWNNYYVTLQQAYLTFQRQMAQPAASVFRGAFGGAMAAASSVTQRVMGSNVTQRVLGYVRQRRRDRARARSPPPGSSPVRANTRNMSPELRERLHSNQWRRDRGYPVNDEYPFPALAFDSPHISPTPTPSTQHEAIESPSTPSSQLQREIIQSTVTNTDSERNRKHPAHPAIPQTPERPQAPRAGILKPRNSRTFRNSSQQTQDRIRRTRELNEALHIQGFDASLRTSRSKSEHRVRFQEPLVTVYDYEPPLTPELAPYLHPSLNNEHPNIEPPKTGLSKTESAEALEEEQKENIAPELLVERDSVPQDDFVPQHDLFVQHDYDVARDHILQAELSAPAAVVEPIEPAEPADLVEPFVDPWAQPPEFPYGPAVSAVRIFSHPDQPIPPGRTESIYADEWRRIEQEQQLEESSERIRPEGPAVRPLSEKWEKRVEDAMRMPNNRKIVDTLSGDPLTKRDLASCFTPMAWLNDEVINSYLAVIIDYLRRENNNDGRHDKPRYHAFNSFFFSNLRDKGYDSVRRWATRAKIGKNDLLNVDTVFIPVHNNSHWTLIVVKPVDKTIEHFDSLGSLSRRHVGVVKTWLKGELGPLFVEKDWAVLPSVSPQQDNGSDCGVFLLSTAKAIAANIDPLAYGPQDTLLLRKKIVAELMNGGLEGDLAPKDVYGDVLL
ncbi:SUMO protease ULP1 [Aspergillus puulaauensis]|uniref:Ubiquitin-like protease family profile domain-containing protein n=1 Tax=Aspergillus puulaauensis TaxID=1220207 RepID=A0A7R7XZ14_9EURO|nr:uncharacterized protein APUU_71118A [Aspergillus puulaauensis]BCS29548.1 hypothetical protein APUU_71118A [Aspergillus puulaauensis]